LGKQILQCYIPVVKKWSGTVDRNGDAIAKLLAELLPGPGTVLEVGSGSGQHAVLFAGKLPSITWIPSDRDEAQIDSIAAWRAEVGLPNLKAPVQVDVTAEQWDVPELRAIVAIDLVANAPWPVCVGLFGGAGRYLPSGGKLVLVTKDLPRPRDEVMRVAASRGLELVATHDVPGGELIVFRRA
jgi:hypothetical protein